MKNDLKKKSFRSKHSIVQIDGPTDIFQTESGAEVPWAGHAREARVQGSAQSRSSTPTERMGAMKGEMKQSWPSRKATGLCILLLAAACTQRGQARVTKIVIDPQKSASRVAGGKPFGAAGPYEKIQGKAYGELDPRDRHNAIIQDIQLAPRNVRGMVEYVATFTLLKPVDMTKSSGIMLYDVVNRGASILAERLESGDVFLSSGWQGDLSFGGKSVYGTDAETVTVPIARNADGSSIEGQILARFSNMASGLDTLPLASAASYATSGAPPLPVDTDTSHAKLTSRLYESVNGASGPVTAISGDDWAWADCSNTPFPGTSNPRMICLRHGFDSKQLYQLEYRGKDPLVLGVGLAAIRDVVSFFRNAKQDDAGWQNPIAGRVSHVIGQGASQSGNTIRTFLNLGFNEDETGKRVWDGAMPMIAARQSPINYRFAIPGGASGLYELGSDGVVWWSDWPDPVRAHPTGGLLDRCNATRTCPKIVEVLGSSEFWSLRASPDFAGTDGKIDIPLPENVRRYYVASTQHGGGVGGFRLVPFSQREWNTEQMRQFMKMQERAAPASAKTPPAAQSAAAPPSAKPKTPPVQNPIVAMPCMLPYNPNPMNEINRALLVALEAWVVKGIDPPPSVYPKLADGTLVPATAAAMGFPVLPGMPIPDGIANPLLVYELGDRFNANDLSGIPASQPVAIGAVIPPVVPRVDEDGNEVGGIHTVLQEAALGTYLGWNITESGYFKGQYCSLWGSYIPFSTTKPERLASHDTRLSIEERYGTQRGYMCVVRHAAKRLVEQRFLLQEDADALIAQAMASGVLPSDETSSEEGRKIADARCRNLPPE